MQIHAPHFYFSSTCLLLYCAHTSAMRTQPVQIGSTAQLSWGWWGKVGENEDSNMGKDVALVPSHPRNDPAPEPATSACIFSPL